VAREHWWLAASLSLMAKALHVCSWHVSNTRNRTCEHICACSCLLRFHIDCILILRLTNDSKRCYTGRKDFIFYRECILQSLLSATTLAYSDIFPNSICCLFSLWMHYPVRFQSKFLSFFNTLHQNFSLKIVLINSLGGATVPYAAYTAFKRISVRFRHFKKCNHLKPHVYTRSR